MITEAGGTTPTPREAWEEELLAGDIILSSIGAGRWRGAMPMRGTDGFERADHLDHYLAPVAVRFGWHQEAEPNLMNKEGLPASPFRTDKW